MPPPIPAPPLAVVEVPVPAGLVAVEVPVWVAVDVGGAVDVPVLVGVLVEVGVLLVVELLDDEEDDEEEELSEQSRAASWLSVPAPWPRLLSSVGLIDDGRLVMSLLSAVSPFCTCEQLCEVRPVETVCRSLARLELWPAESSPVLLPHATTNATANPRPPARNAREPKPIRRLTLEAGPICRR